MTNDEAMTFSRLMQLAACEDVYHPLDAFQMYVHHLLRNAVAGEPCEGKVARALASFYNGAGRRGIEAGGIIQASLDRLRKTEAEEKSIGHAFLALWKSIKHLADVIWRAL